MNCWACGKPNCRIALCGVASCGSGECQTKIVDAAQTNPPIMISFDELDDDADQPQIIDNIFKPPPPAA